MRGNHLGSLVFCGEGGRGHLGRDTRRLIASRRRGWKATKTIRTVYRKESSACGEAARAMRGNHLGFLSFCGEGGRVHLGRDTRRLTASRRRGWKAAKTIRTVYRKESSACGEAARAMRGNHLGSLSFCGEGGRGHLGRDTRRLTAYRRAGWKAAKTIRTVYRKESSACGEAARAMRGNHLGSLSFCGEGGRGHLGRDTRRLTAYRRAG